MQGQREGDGRTLSGAQRLERGVIDRANRSHLCPIRERGSPGFDHRWRGGMAEFLVNGVGDQHFSK